MAAFQRGCHLGQSLQHESIVPGIGLGIIVHEREADPQRLAMLVGPARRMFERRVVFSALTLLHPVQHIVASFTGLAIVQCADAGAFDLRDGHILVRCARGGSDPFTFLDALADLICLLSDRLQVAF
jgi:hypothetical protein